MKNTLHLNLKKKWFDMILSGEKLEEYRETTDYWRSRICNKEEAYFQTGKENDLMLFKKFDAITFSNAYSKNRPQFEIELKDIQLSTGYEKWGAKRGEIYYVFKLGKILSTKNILQNNNENYLQSKIELAKNTWKDIDVDEYLKQVRGE